MPAPRVDHRKELQQIAGHWKNFDPEAYERFLRHLDALTFEITVAVTEAPAPDVLQAQGRAQNARQFMLMFTEALAPKNATP